MMSASFINPISSRRAHGFAGVVVACLVVLSPTVASAAPITWSAPRDIAGDSDVSSNGQLVRAVCKAGSLYPTVNGVTFTPAYGADTVAGVNAYNYTTGALPVGGGISAGYAAMLSQNDYGNVTGSTLTLTLNGLARGAHYELQVWFHDSNAAGQGTLTVKSSGSTDPWVLLDANTSGVAGGIGQFALGTFTADGTTQAVSLQGSVNGMIQAYQLRRVAAPLASVAWEAWQETTDEADVSTLGTSERAYVFGSAAPSAAVNGVSFTRFATQGSDTLFGFTTPSADGFGSASAPFASLSSDYQNLLAGAASGGKAASLTLNHLQPGQWYQAQVWVNDSRACAAGRMERINGSLYLNYNPGGPSDNPAYEGGLGHWMTGNFQAIAASQRFDFVADVSAQINAMQLRAIPAPDAFVHQFKARRLYFLNSFMAGQRTCSSTWANVQGWYATGNLAKAKQLTSTAAASTAGWTLGATSSFELWPAMDLLIRWKKYVDATSRAKVLSTLRKYNFASWANTSNLSKLSWTVRTLGSQEFGEGAFLHPANDWRPLDPRGYGNLLARVDGEAKNGAGEYASCPYGWYNMMPTLSLAQLCTDTTLRTHSMVSFNSDLAQLAAVWMPADGYLGTWSGRSYPESGSAMSLGRNLWYWFGSGSRSGECKEAIMAAAMNYLPPATILHAAGERSTIYTSRHRCDAYQTGYVWKDQYILFSHDGSGGGNQQYCDGVRWKGMQNYCWLTKPAADDPLTVHGSGNHCNQNSDYSTVQAQDSMLLAFDLSYPKASALHYAYGYVPGNYQAMVNLTGPAVSAGTPNRIFLHYGTVMICITSDIPFTWNPSSGVYATSGTAYSGDSEFRVAVGGVGNPITDAAGYQSTIDPANNRFAMAVETAHPSEYAGASAAAQLDAFKADVLAHCTISHDAPSPTVACYTNRHGTQLKVQSKAGGAIPPAYINGVALNYNSTWPQLESPWMSQAQGGTPATFISSQQQTVLDFTNWTTTNTTLAYSGTIPQLTSNAASGITNNSSVISGSLLSDGGGTTAVTLYYGTSDGGTTTASWSNSITLGAQNLGDVFTTLNGLAANTTYFFRHFASNSAGSAWAASSSSFMTGVVPVPGVPDGLSSVLTVGSVPLTWTAASDAATYNIKRATTSGGPYTTIASDIASNSHADGTGSPGTVYYYVVSAVNAGGESANSGEVIGSPAVPPSAPGNVAASSGYLFARVTWNAVSWAANYNIKRSSTSGGPYTTIATNVAGPSYDDSTSVNQSTYYYVVSAVNAVGESTNSAQASVTVNVTSFINQTSGNWNNVTWLPSPPGRPTSGTAAIIDFFNGSPITSTNDMGTFTMNQLRFLGQSVTLGGNALTLGGTTPSVTVSNGVSATASNAITLGAATSFNLGGSLTLNGIVSGANSLTKIGGALTFGANNSFTGNTTLGGGSLTYSADNSGVKTLVLGASAGETLANAVNLNANVNATSVNVQTSNVTNSLNIAAGKSFAVTSSWLQGGLNTTQAASHLRASGAGGFVFNNATGTMTVRRGSILDLSAVANATIIAANLNLGDLDNYTQANPATLIVSADGNTTIRADTINLDSAYAGGGNSRGESASFIAPGGSGSLTIRNAAGTGPAALLMDKHAGSGSAASTTTFDSRGHYADISLSTLDLAHRTAASGGGSGMGFFYFDEGILSVSGVTWVATCDAGVQTNNATIEMSGGTANFVGGINLGTSTTGRTLTAEFNVVHGAVGCGKIIAAVATPGFVAANINLTGGTLTMTDDMIGGAVSGSVGGYASSGQARLIVDGGTLDMAGRAIGTATRPFSSVAFYSGTVRNVGSINGAAGFTKSAPGVLVVEGANTYTGATTINIDPLEVNGSIASTALMTISSGAMLGGTGRIASPVSVSGGLAPGSNNIGMLTVNNTLTLASNSSTTMTIDRASAANSSAVQGVSTMTYAGTLNVTNNGSAPVDGDRFVLFGAGTYLGTFTTLNLPTLDAGLDWDTRALNIDGSIVVRATVGGGIMTAKYWDTNASAGLQGGSGSWDIATSSFWNTASDGSAGLTRFWQGDTAYFQNGVANNVAVSGLVAVDSIAQSVNGTSTSISGGTLLINGSSSLSNGVGSGNGALAIHSSVVLNSLDVTMTAVQPITLNGGLGGAGDLTKSGAGTLTLGASSPWAGALILDGGSVTLNGDALNLLGITYGATIASANASALNLNGNAMVPGMHVQNTGANTLTIAAGSTLTVNGTAVLGINGNTTGTGSCTLTSNGAGTMVVNNPGSSFIVAGGKAGLTMTADFANLNAMQVNLGTTGTFYLGVYYSVTSDTLRLAANTTINAATISIGDANTGGTYTLQFGRGANVINANNFYIAQRSGANNRSDAAVKFDPSDTTGTLRLRAADGIGRVNLTMNDSSTTTGRSLSSSFDVAGHNADLLLGNLIVGRRNGTTSATTATTDVFKWDKGTLDVANQVLLETAPTANNKPCTGTMTLGSIASTAADTVNFANGIIVSQNLGTATSGSAANGTLTIAGGTVRLKNIVLGDLVGSSTSRQSDATLNLTGGNLTMSGSIASGTSGGSGMLTAAFNLNGTALDMGGNPIGAPGLGSITTLTFQSGTLTNVSAINGTAGITKTSAGKLTLGGTNTFTGPIAVNAGTLQLTGALTAPITVASGATFIHGGSITGDVTLANGATEAPDTSPTLCSISGNYTLNTGATLRVRLNGSTAGTQYDQLAISGTVTLGGALEVVAGPNLAPGSTFTIINKTGTTPTSTTFTGKAENSIFTTSEGYTFGINYNAGTGNDIVLSLVTTPIEQWRFTHFGSVFNTGPGLDTADNDHDGVANLIEYATNMNPALNDVVPQSVTRTGSTLEFVHTRNKAATDVTIIVEWSDTLLDDWHTSGVGAPTVLSDNGTTQQIKTIVPADSARRFVHLKVTRP